MAVKNIISEISKRRRNKPDADISDIVEIKPRSKQADMQNVQNPYDDIAAAQRQLLEAQAAAQKSSALMDIESERERMLPQFQQQRNVISGQQAQRAKALDEKLARSGLVGSTTQANLLQKQAGLEQGLLGESMMQQQQYEQDLARRKAAANQAYQQALTQGGLQLGIQGMQDALAREQYNQQLALQEAGLTGMLRGTPTMAGQQFGLQQQMTQEQIANFPLQRQLLEQQVQSGQISLEQAQLQLDMLQNPGKYQTYTGGTVVTPQQPVVTPERPPTYAPLGYQDLANLLDQGNPRFDREQNRTVYDPTSPIDKIRQIQSNYNSYVNRFGQEAVDKMVEDLGVEAGLVQVETPPVDQDAVMTEELNAAFQDMAASGDPLQWLESNQSFLTLEEYNELYKQAMNMTQAGQQSQFNLP